MVDCTPYMAGRNACKAGDDRASNPHVPHNSDHNDWNSGYDDQACNFYRCERCELHGYVNCSYSVCVSMRKKFAVELQAASRNRCVPSGDAMLGTVGTPIDIAKKYQTRDGRDVRIYAVANEQTSGIHGAVENKNIFYMHSWNDDGISHRSKDFDLIEVKPRVQKRGYIGIFYRPKAHELDFSQISPTLWLRETKYVDALLNDGNYLTLIKCELVEWSE